MKGPSICEDKTSIKTSINSGVSGIARIYMLRRPSATALQKLHLIQTLIHTYTNTHTHTTETYTNTQRSKQGRERRSLRNYAWFRTLTDRPVALRTCSCPLRMRRCICQESFRP